MLSLVVPVYNEEANLPEFYARLRAALLALGEPFEVIFIDDGSQDGSSQLIRLWHQEDKRVKGIRLSRNFGHEAATSAGLEYAQGDAVVVIDADLQDPPEVIPQLVAKWREGFEVVYAVRSERLGEPAGRRMSSALFYRLFRRLVRFEHPVDTGDFRVMDRRVVEAFRRLPERHRFVRGLIGWLGFRQTGIPYCREPRHGGRTKYSTLRRLGLAVEAVTAFSFLPLRLATWLGFLLSAFSFAYGFFAIGVKLFTNIPVSGWTSLIVAITFLGGIQLMTLGIIGEYIGRIYGEVKQRPLYIIESLLGVDTR